VSEGWFSRLKKGLRRSSARLGQGIAALLPIGRTLNAETLSALEDLLIEADLGIDASAALVGALAKMKLDRDAGADAVKDALAGEIGAMLAPVAIPLTPDKAISPFVILVVGVNGSGKTTTIGKMAKQMKDEGHTVMLAAADTFRAAAVQQLKIWGERSHCPVISGAEGADPAGLAFEALRQAKEQGCDRLLIDSAGRLHNKADLMAELSKIVRVLKKQDPTAPHEVLLVLDATIGQNALRQVETFKDMVGVTGLAVTKLDGSAKGGVLIALAKKFGLPVRLVGIGEGIEDLRPFDADNFARALLGLD
jgi:fused signal recognition particle receptor